MGNLLATIDRFEEDERGRRLAVLVFDDEQQLVVEAEDLPEGARRGEVLRLRAELFAERTEAQADHVRRLQDELFG